MRENLNFSTLWKRLRASLNWERDFIEVLSLHTVYRLLHCEHEEGEAQLFLFWIDTQIMCTWSTLNLVNIIRSLVRFGPSTFSRHFWASPLYSRCEDAAVPWLYPVHGDQFELCASTSLLYTHNNLWLGYVISRKEICLAGFIAHHIGIVSTMIWSGSCFLF